MSNLWGGAHDSINDAMLSFTSASDTQADIIPEQILIPYDIQTNIAHIEALQQAKIITKTEMDALKKDLELLLKEYHEGVFLFDSSFEDIHSQIEFELVNRTGEIGKKIHTARSRNDQVTTDMFLYLKDKSQEAIVSIKNLVETLSKLSESHMDTACPGYTHHQKAVVTSFGDILNAYVTMLNRDVEHLKAIISIYDYLPLGAVTGYESLIKLDKTFIAKKLGFSEVHKSSVDVISSRGEFEAAFASALSRFMTHASMLSQTLIILSSQAYGYVTINDSFTTGSSVMPHKKNPDMLEIIKAKSVYGRSLSSALESILQSAFVGYNRDSQYSKRIVMQLHHEYYGMPELLAELIQTMTVHKDKMLQAANTHHVTTTGFMELLVVERSIALRDAKRLVERAVYHSDDEHTITLKSIQKATEDTGISVEITEDELKKWTDPSYQLERRRFGV